MSKFTIQCNKCSNKIDIDYQKQLMNLLLGKYSIYVESDTEYGVFYIQCDKCNNKTTDLD